MFPYRKLMRLLFKHGCFLVVTCTFLFLLISLLSLSSSPSRDTAKQDSLLFYQWALLGGERFYTDDVTSLKSRLQTQFRYQETLRELAPSQLENLTKTYFRNITIQYSERELLPPSKPVYHEECLQYLDSNYDTTVSVVIPYYNELAILLMRTLTLITHRTLPKYLEEIILIDDGSSVNIREEVMQYVREQQMPVRYIRNPEQLGIANSRIKGIREAKGDVVVILDSHIEVMELWLEPLLSHIRMYPKSIAVPSLQMITETQYKTLGLRHVDRYVVKAQKGHGVISMAPYREKDPTRRKWEHYPSSAMMGGALVAFKSTLLELYPRGLVGRSWGVENIRLAFRSWMCAEGIWVSPCSSVMHVNGYDWSLSRYFETGEPDLYAKLLAEGAAELLNYVGDEAERTRIVQKTTHDQEMQKMIWNMADEIRSEWNPDKHGCRDYRYYKEEVYEDLVSWASDQFTHIGDIESVSVKGMCLEEMSGVVNPYPCRNKPLTLGDPHTHGVTKNKVIMNGANDGQCWDTGWKNEEGVKIHMYPCHVLNGNEGVPWDPQMFQFHEQTNQIVHVKSGRCVELMNKAEAVWLMKCDKSKQEQRWKFRYPSWF